MLAYLRQTRSLLEQLQAPSSLKALRERAWDHFLKLGLPDKEKEAFQYVSLKDLYERSFSPLEEASSFSYEEIEKLIYPEAKNSYLVFINGFFQPSFSNLSALPSQVVILPLEEAMRSYGTSLHNRWSKTLSEETDPFALLNLSLHPRGAFIYIPPKIRLEHPVQCLFLSTDKSQFSFPRVQLFIGAQAEVQVITAREGKGFANEVMDATLEEGAKMFCLEASMRNEEGICFSHLRATLKKESFLSATLSPYSQGVITRHSMHVALRGERAEATLQGGWHLKKKEEMHVHALVKHEAPFCKSMQKFKGMVDEYAHSSFEGKIFVTPQAQKTEAYQLNNNLILGQHASAYSKPNLEIFADDVKASHGATVSQLDKEQLFYLKSRGLGEEEAKNLLVQGFIGEIIHLIPYPSIHHALVRYVQSTPSL